MAKRNFIGYLLNPKNWWLPLLLIFVVSMVGVTLIGVHTYTEAPPVPDYVSSKNERVFSREEVLKGQAVFQKYALMEYGSMFGDGANRGPDYTAEALHLVSQYMNIFYQRQLADSGNREWQEKGVAEQVRSEIKRNQYNKEDNKAGLTDAQTYAASELVNITGKFTAFLHPGI
jgi:nitric oxide reductase subunit B